MQTERAAAGGVPSWLKWSYTAFLAVLVPVYWANYGPTNFLYFCDISLFLTLAAVWTQKPIFASMAAVGLLIPQLLWCVDFAAELTGLHLASMTAYMFNSSSPLHLRALSLFHGWLPFLLFFLVVRLGYDRRAFVAWTLLAIALCLIAYFLLPPAGAVLENKLLPRNVNYVCGCDDAKPQTWMHGGAYLVVWIVALTLIIYLPTHLFLKRFVRAEV